MKTPVVSRRSFLKSSAAAASSIGFPMFIPSRVLAGPEAPSNKINVGLIGNGLIMQGHRGYLSADEGVQVVAVCDVHKEKLDKALAEVKEKSKVKGECQAVAEFEAVIERADVDAVVIGTPDHWHAAIALAAIRAGKDVYVEKPMTLTVLEAQLVREAALRHGRIVQVGTQQRSERAFRKAVEIVRNGWIGKVHTIYAKLGEFPAPGSYPEMPVPAGFDYDRWLGPTPWFPYNDARVKGDYGGGWRCFWEYGSRKNGDWGAHHFDIIQWALDMDDSGPVEFIPKGFGGAEFQTHIYADGTKVHRKDAGIKNDHMIHFVGEKGEVFVSRGDKLETTPEDLAKKALGPNDIRVYESTNHRANWLEGIRTRKQTICHAGVGARTAHICQLSGIAERLGRPIKWDPKKEEIIGDPAAARWLDRPRRAGYAL